MALFAYLFVEIISTAQYLGQQDYLGANSNALIDILLPFIWLLSGFQARAKIERLREGFETARANRLDLRVTLLVYRENERKRGRP